MSVRLGARLGPEAIATILVVVVVALGVSIALSGRFMPAGNSGTGTVPSAQPSGAGSAIPSPAESSSPPSTPARALLEIVDRLLEQRTALASEVAKRHTDVATIADHLREVNAALLLQEAPLAELAADAATADLAARIHAVNEATFDAVRRTQRASVTNAQAYHDGASEVVATLAPLTGIRTELAALAGSSPSPAPIRVQPTVAPSPSGATP